MANQSSILLVTCNVVLGNLVSPPTLTEVHHLLEMSHLDGSGSPAGQCCLPHHKSCSVMTRELWQRAQCINLDLNSIEDPSEMPEQVWSTVAPPWIGFGSDSSKHWKQELWGSLLVSGTRELAVVPLNPVGCEVAPPRIWHIPQMLDLIGNTGIWRPDRQLELFVMFLRLQSGVVCGGRALVSKSVSFF